MGKNTHEAVSQDVSTVEHFTRLNKPIYGKMPEQRIYTAKHQHTTDISSRNSQSTHIKVTNCSTTEIQKVTHEPRKAN